MVKVETPRAGKVPSLDRDEFLGPLVGSISDGASEYKVVDLGKLGEQGYGDPYRLPFSIRVLLENVVRHYDGSVVTEREVRAVALWELNAGKAEIPFHPARVIMQDFTGIPALVDLAAMRDSVRELGGDPSKINPMVPVDLIIDHSVQVDFHGASYAFYRNVEREYERNRERYVFLKWAQKAFRNLRVSPPGKGIIHQVNLEYLAKVVVKGVFRGDLWAYPDTLLGTDSHTTMINSLGVLGWGVGGIEAEAVILGQPYFMLLPEVVGVRLEGELNEGATATDLVLYVTEKLRKHGVVGKFVEFHGPGVKALSVPDRATVANMAPEYGATMGFFPIDEATIDYLRSTGRDPSHVRLVEAYARSVGLWYDPSGEEPRYTETITVDLGDVEPSISGPGHPEDRIPLASAKRVVEAVIEEYRKGRGGPAYAEVGLDGVKGVLRDGSVVLAAITSCTNTSNPSLMVAAGILAKKAVERGLVVKPWVKTSNAPGSRAVVGYWERTGLMPYLEALGFHVVGFGCTVCIGNSGPLKKGVEEAVRESDIYAVTVLSGNRNFSGRIHPAARGNFLASPPLVVAYALAGRVDIDFQREPIGIDPNGNPVYLRDIWPSPSEVREAVEKALDPGIFLEKYRDLFRGDERWEALRAPEGDLYEWDPSNTYIKKPPFFEGISLEPGETGDIIGARVLVWAPDRTSTDHISPAGRIPASSLAGRYLIAQGVEPGLLNTYGSRRGNHEVMVRGTFDNPRFRNRLVPDREGAWTVYWPTGEIVHVYEAASRYMREGVPLIILAGKQYGAGSSRDWAAKGPYLLGVKAVIAESYERIHRSNLVGMGILPLEFLPGESADKLGLDGSEVYDILGIAEGLYPGKMLRVRAVRENGETVEFRVKARLDTPIEVEYYRHGGILQYVLRKIVSESS